MTPATAYCPQSKLHVPKNHYQRRKPRFDRVQWRSYYRLRIQNQWTDLQGDEGSFENRPHQRDKPLSVCSVSTLAFVASGPFSLSTFRTSHVEAICSTPYPRIDASPGLGPMCTFFSEVPHHYQHGTGNLISNFVEHKAYQCLSLLDSMIRRMNDYLYSTSCLLDRDMLTWQGLSGFLTNWKTWHRNPAGCRPTWVGLF